MAMRRRTLHLAFGLGCAVAGGLAGYFAGQWQHAGQINAAITAAGESDAPLNEQASPESQLARALALSRQGAADAAIRAYKALAADAPDDMRLTIGYDLGNLYLREALKDGADEAMRHAPLIELAKQSYRAVLRRNGEDWDARHNLELALRLAPERDDDADASAEPAVPKERAITTMQGHKLVLP
jgi:mxaK protein